MILDLTPEELSVIKRLLEGNDRNYSGRQGTLRVRTSLQGKVFTALDEGGDESIDNTEED